MSRRLLAAVTAALMLFAAVPASIAIGARTVPEGYNEHDIIALTRFLDAASAVEGKSNGQLLDPEYDPADPSTYSHDPDYGDSNTYSFAWQKDENGELRLSSVEIRDKVGLAGELDLAGCTGLVSVSLWDLPCVTGLGLAGCTALETLYCRFCGVSFIEANGCASLWMLNVGENDELKTIDISDTSLPVSGVYAGGGGSVGAYFDGEACLLTAAEQGEPFVGWYDENDAPVCAEAEFAPSFEGGAYTARFGAAQPMAGDVDGNGVVGFTDVSVLYSSLIGAGAEEIPASAADLNGDGVVSFIDVSVLYCRMLGAA